MADIYMSYASDDSVIAGTLRKGLERYGYSTWMYNRDLLPGLNYREQIEEAIDSCSVFLLIISTSSSRHPQVAAEVLRASENGKHFLPLLYGLTYGQFCVEGAELRAALGDVTAITLTDEGVETTLPRLLDALKRFGFSRGEEVAERQAEVRAHGQLAKEHGFDVFISYRRDSDSQTARLLRAELQQRCLRVFLDVDDLRSGHFDEALLERIRESRNFLVILSQDSLDRCSSPEDWLRREVACALAENKNVVPIMMPDFAFPAEDKLPDDLRFLRLHNGVPYSHYFFAAMMDKIMTYLDLAETSS